VLGETPGLSAREVAERTAMDKVQVSRAVASLVAARRVARTPDDKDGRVGRLALTRAGMAIYEEIVPLALSLERTFVAALSRDEREALDRLLSKLTRQAKTLNFN
jgi:DNA-binding MarR family transcriptional regulator